MSNMYKYIYTNNLNIYYTLYKNANTNTITIIINYNSKTYKVAEIPYEKNKSIDTLSNYIETYLYNNDNICIYDQDDILLLVIEKNYKKDIQIPSKYFILCNLYINSKL